MKWLMGFLLVLSFLLPPSTYGQPQRTFEWSPVVEELVSLVEENGEVRELFEKALAAQEKGAFWHGKTRNDFYLFLEEWRTFSPGLKTAMAYGDPFASLYSRSNHGRPVHGRSGSVEEGYELVRNPLFADWMGKFISSRKEFLDSRESLPVVGEWLQTEDIDMSIYQTPVDGFSSFNDFFTRELKEGVRPISEPKNQNVVVSPADCSLATISSRLTAQETFEVKGGECNVAALLDDVELAKTFEGGQALLCFLMPNNYHRFHAPISGDIESKEQLGGFYFGARGFIDHFFEHRRGYYIINNPDLGKVGFVAVGIAEISSVNLTHEIGDSLEKGDEVGHFAYGGSAIILLFEPGAYESLEVNVAPGRRGRDVKMGEAIGTIR